LSHCSSKFRIISSKESPSGAPEGLKTQAHAQQPKPRKRLVSIQISLRLAAIIGGRQNRECGCFLSFFPLSPYMVCRIIHCTQVALRMKSAQQAVSIGPRAESAARVVWFYSVLLGKSDIYGRRIGSVCLRFSLLAVRKRPSYVEFGPKRARFRDTALNSREDPNSVLLKRSNDMSPKMRRAFEIPQRPSLALARVRL
jgi:hypothetical protein